MAAGRKQQPQQQGQGVVAVVSEQSVAKRMWRVLRAVLYMLRRGLPSGRKLAMDLHLLLHRGKIAGKALGDLLHGHHHRDATGFSSSSYAGGSSSSFSCRALDPGVAVHEPSSCARRREVEFSCSNTPSSADLGGLLGKRSRRSRRRRDDAGAGYQLHYYSNYDAADVARVFEMLNDEHEPTVAATAATAAYETPSPAQMLWALARSPALSKHLRESPAASSGGRDGDGRAQVDRQADEFIRRFYEQLRAQKSAASTPDYYGYAASPYVSGGRRTPRPLPAAIA